MWPFASNSANRCGGCKGTGDCSRCKGKGSHEDDGGNAAQVLGGIACRRCDGTGVCVGCRGSGWVSIVKESGK